MFKWMRFVFCYFSFIPAGFTFNFAYVEVNSNQLANVGCYLQSDTRQPFFGGVSIFAGNINGRDPNHPVIYLNPQVQALLQTKQVTNLQNKGVKVFMTLLGDHENAGWACMTDANAANRFADDVVALVNQYHFDGIDIDDEYSNCNTNNYSMIMLAQAIKNHPGFAGKLLTKALFADSEYFRAEYQGHHLAEYLDYGWEMSYGSGSFDQRLAVYLANGMTPAKLMLGGWANLSYPSPYVLGQYTQNKSLAGMMVYDITTHSQDYLQQMLKGDVNDQLTIEVQAGCLR